MTKLCACRKGCRKPVKGPGVYALGHAPGSHIGRLPRMIRKLKEKYEAQEKDINTRTAEEKAEAID